MFDELPDGLESTSDRDIFLVPASNTEAQKRLHRSVTDEFTVDKFQKLLEEDSEALYKQTDNRKETTKRLEEEREKLQNHLDQIKDNIGESEAQHSPINETSGFSAENGDAQRGIEDLRQERKRVEARLEQISQELEGSQVNDTGSTQEKEEFTIFQERAGAGLRNQFWAVTESQYENYDISAGDIFFFYEGDTEYRHAAIVDTDYHVPDLSEVIWETEGEKSYPYLIFFHEVWEINVSSKIIAQYADHDIDWVMGFMRLNDRGQQAIKADYGDYERFLEAAVDGIFEIPGDDSPAQGELETEQTKSTLQTLNTPSDSPLSDFGKVATHLRAKNQIILAGPPGTGKLAGARQFAQKWLREDETDIEPDARIQETKFSPDLSSATFIDGTDSENDTELLTGPLGHLCDLAVAGPGDAKHVLIIDDFHRGDCRDIFGEAWPLISRSRRGRAYSIRLDSSRVEFWVPDNVYIIGIIDTGEQSLQGLPTAIRRRFRPIVTAPMYQRLLEAYSSDDDGPGPDSAVTEEGRQSIRALYTLNRLLEQHHSCRANVRLGHMYLSVSEEMIQPYTDQHLLADVWEYDILPQCQSFISDSAATELSEDTEPEAGLVEIDDFDDLRNREKIWDLVESLAEQAPAKLPE